jgi:hypothetical protein
MNTGIIVGKGIGGTTKGYLTNRFNKTGGAGNRVSIGRINKRGVSKVCDPERSHNSNPGSQVNSSAGANNSRETTKE